MNGPIRITSLLIFFAFTGLSIWSTAHWLAHAQSQDGKKTEAVRIDPYAQLDEKASAVKGADEQAIRQLADAVFLLIVGDQIPSLFVSPYKERFVRAEINYRSGQKAGIPEANIVRVIDELARTLNAPEYARTDEEEVRDTRLAVSLWMPHFIVHQAAGTGEGSSTEQPYTLNPVMSPLEALYVTHFLIMQKQINQSSQITSAERAELKARVKRLEEEGFRLTQPERGEVMRALIEQKLDPEKPQVTAEDLAKRAQQQRTERTGAFLSFRRSTARDQEMQEVFRRAQRMKVGDAIALANRSLELLGVDN